MKKKKQLLHGMGKKLLITMALSGIFSDSLTAAEAPQTILETGIQSFREQKFEAAMKQMQKAVENQPGDIAAQLWLGLAHGADGQPWQAMSAWRNGVGSPKWEPIADYLRGLGWWKMGMEKDAIR